MEIWRGAGKQKIEHFVGGPHILVVEQDQQIELDVAGTAGFHGSDNPIEGTAVSDDVLPHVAKFANLRELDLSGCNITDTGLTAVARLTSLEVLWLTNTKVTDVGLAKLHGLKQLKFVDVEGSRVTAEGWAALKKAVPAVSDKQE